MGLLNGLAMLMNNTGFSIDNFLANLNTSLASWGQVLVIIIGLAMVIVAVFKIAKGLMSGGKGQVNWVLNLALFFIGGALAFGGGWNLVQKVSEGGSSTINDLGGNTPAAGGGTP